MDVLNNGRLSEGTLHLQKGLNEIAIKAVDPWMVMQKFVLRSERDKKGIPYLGPRETYRI